MSDLHLEGEKYRPWPSYSCIKFIDWFLAGNDWLLLMALLVSQAFWFMYYPIGIQKNMDKGHFWSGINLITHNLFKCQSVRVNVAAPESLKGFTSCFKGKASTLKWNVDHVLLHLQKRAVKKKEFLCFFSVLNLSLYIMSLRPNYLNMWFRFPSVPYFFFFFWHILHQFLLLDIKISK